MEFELFWNSFLSALVIPIRGYDLLIAMSIFGTDSPFKFAFISSFGSVAGYLVNYIIGRLLFTLANRVNSPNHKRVIGALTKIPTQAKALILFSSANVGWLGHYVMLILAYIRINILIFMLFVALSRFFYCMITLMHAP